jgi:hypothetical protein
MSRNIRSKYQVLSIKKIKTIIVICILTSFFLILTSVYAGPQSASYELKDWGFGAGGEASTSSNTYSMFGTAGEIDVASTESNTYRNNAGLIFPMQAQTPVAPTFANTGNNYDRLHIIINTSSNPIDTEFAAQIALNSDNNWTNAQYVQNDGTIGSTLGAEDWMKYNTGTYNWGDTTGIYITGLSQNTAYKIRVKARQGNFTETGWGPSIVATTVNPSLTFGIDSAAITFNRLNSSNSYTDTSKSTVLSTTTNAYNGYIIYGRDTNAMDTTFIPNYASANSSPSTWTSIGFGYSTNDSNLSGGTADRFTNGGPKFAGFGTDAPGDPVADHSGPILSSVSDDFTISYRITAASNTPAATYSTTVLYVVVPTY